MWTLMMIPLLCAAVASLAAAPLGCLLAWRRLIYFGEALAHASLLGVAVALHLRFPPALGMALVSALLVLLLFILQRQNRDDGNRILGSLSHFFLALGVILMAQLSHVRSDLQSYLFGDVLATTARDLLKIGLVSLLTLLLLKRFWRAWVLGSLSRELAQCELAHPRWLDAGFLLLLALFMATMVHYFGLLLVVALLIIPANTAQRWARTPEGSAWGAAAVALLAALLGSWLSWEADLPLAPAMVSVAGALYLLSVAFPFRRQKR